MNDKTRGIKKPFFPRTMFRYHFFTIWPNGFYALDAILDLLRKNDDLEILSIQEHTVANMRKFVHDLYACDSVPVWHLESKLRYLYKLPPKVINVFAKNYNPQEELSGTGAFRKKQCKTMVGIKTKIRNAYNPKHPDPAFQVAPLEKGVTHEHVIHASDREEQTDYYLKLLGHREGIKHLEKNDLGLFFEKPHHIARPRRYSFQCLPISSLCVSIVQEQNGKIAKKLLAVNETPHYKSLNDGNNEYENYLHQFRFKFLKDDYSVERFNGMKALSIDRLKALSPVLVRQAGDTYIVLDGGHRAAIHLFRGFEQIDCVVFEG